MSSLDSTARIWTIGNGSIVSSSGRGPSSAVVLKHRNSKRVEEKTFVLVLDWNGDGALLATGSTDGQARIWNTKGELKGNLSKHKGPIFSLKWNKRGDYILTGSTESTIVWDVSRGKPRQQFQFHTGRTHTADWRNNVSFATGSKDCMIYVCKIGDTKPVGSFCGHQGEVKCVRWDPTGSLLASCSVDTTVKIWSVKSGHHSHDLRGHAKEVYAVSWSPTGPGTDNSNLPLVLASASHDWTVKLWDPEHGKLLHSFDCHRDVACAFSPDGKYLATGSRDHSLYIWSVKEGKLMKTYTGRAAVSVVCWSCEGQKVAAGFLDGKVGVFDSRL